VVEVGSVVLLSYAVWKDFCRRTTFFPSSSILQEEKDQHHQYGVGSPADTKN